MTRAEICQRLNVSEGNRIILSLDGGGMRGIFTLQLLKRLEEVAGAPLYKWVDMVAGTSTGAIIAGLISCGKTAAEIEDLYVRLVSQVFTKRSALANRFYNPPAFDKEKYRALLKSIVGDRTLEHVCRETGIDLLFTAKDLSAGEETFFVCVNNNGVTKNAYRSALLRGVLEATMSAPTYFSPFERFADGGTTTFNNPVMAAVMEALFYDRKGKYKSDALTVFSFGTSTALRFIDPDNAHRPKGMDAVFWLNYVMSEASKDAGEMQVDALRSGLIPGLDFRRFQLSLDTTAFKKLPDHALEGVNGTRSGSIHALTDKELSDIDMADVSKFGLMQAIGKAMADYICPPHEASSQTRTANWFTCDLVNPGTTRGQLVTAHGDVLTNVAHISSAEWIDGEPSA